MFATQPQTDMHYHIVSSLKHFPKQYEFVYIFLTFQFLLWNRKSRGEYTSVGPNIPVSGPGVGPNKPVSAPGVGPNTPVSAPGVGPNKANLI